MGERMIGLEPPRDGQDWDNQCARCGSSLMREDCDNCAGDGYVEVESLEGWDEGDTETCDYCEGRGGYWICMSTREWCDANPLPFREDTVSGMPEWFTIGRKVR